MVLPRFLRERFPLEGFIQVLSILLPVALLILATSPQTFSLTTILRNMKYVKDKFTAPPPPPIYIHAHLTPSQYIVAYKIGNEIRRLKFDPAIAYTNKNTILFGPEARKHAAISPSQSYENVLPFVLAYGPSYTAKLSDHFDALPFNVTQLEGHWYVEHERAGRKALISMWELFVTQMELMKRDVEKVVGQSCKYGVIVLPTDHIYHSSPLDKVLPEDVRPKEFMEEVVAYTKPNWSYSDSKPTWIFVIQPNYFQWTLAIEDDFVDSEFRYFKNCELDAALNELDEYIRAAADDYGFDYGDFLSDSIEDIAVFGNHTEIHPNITEYLQKQYEIDVYTPGDYDNAEENDDFDEKDGIDIFEYPFERIEELLSGAEAKSVLQESLKKGKKQFDNLLRMMGGNSREPGVDPSVVMLMMAAMEIANGGSWSVELVGGYLYKLTKSAGRVGYQEREGNEKSVIVTTVDDGQEKVCSVEMANIPAFRCGESQNTQFRVSVTPGKLKLHMHEHTPGQEPEVPYTKVKVTHITSGKTVETVCHPALGDKRSTKSMEQFEREMIESFVGEYPNRDDGSEARSAYERAKQMKASGGLASFAQEALFKRFWELVKDRPQTGDTICPSRFLFDDVRYSWNLPATGVIGLTDAYE
ncbi:hypothetical protein HK097_011265 [Rhizophlyctis rosea]|uniref:Uncharacterized protein n=1 Tax=Rhizophlyctis rosea TaxID=64517 RepID=A0AAD5SH06_9FUNG|nr:hypothetical protein HK097_011265 [Rhizophlyctis rosea]